MRTPSAAAALVRFHERHKLLLMAHSPAALAALGRLVAEAGRQPTASLGADYMELFRRALERPATRGGHVNALQHMAGYLRRVVTDDDRREAGRAIDSFAAGETSLATPLSIIRQHAAAYDVAYLLDQVYLDESRAVEIDQ